MRIAIAGSGRLGLSLLMPLTASSHEVVALLQNGRKRPAHKTRLRKWGAALSKGANDLVRQARWLGLPILRIDTMSENELAPLRALKPDLVLVGGFGVILTKPLLELPRAGCVNVHSSLLPKHRGPNPFAAVILTGESESGVTFHIMDEGIDTGAILEQHRFALLPEYTVFAVYRRACETTAEHVVHVVDQMAREGLRGAPQDNAEATYDKRFTKEDARIRWDDSAERISRQVRALAPALAPHFEYRGRRVQVTRVQTDPSPAGAAPGTVLENRPHVTVATGQGSVRLVAAFVSAPVPWPWPALWSRPAVGEGLLVDGGWGLL